VTCRLAILSVSCLLALTARAEAQRPLVSTITELDSTATFVGEALKRFADRDRQQWTFIPEPDCSAAAARARDGVLLTTEPCLRRLQGTDANFSASVGLPLLLFRLKSESAKPLPSELRVGVIAAADWVRPAIENALSVFLGRTVLVQARVSSESDLFGALRSGTYHAVVVLEDGSGSSVSALIDAATNDSSGEIRIEPVNFEVRPDKPQVAASALSVPTNSVLPRNLATAASTLPQRTLILAFADLEPDRRRPEGPSSVFAFFFPAPSAQTRQRPSFAPKRVSVPVLVSSTALPADLHEAFGYAKLAAPVDGLLNPCRFDSEPAYRAFLRAAVAAAAPAPERALAIWEHGELLKGRGLSTGHYSLSAARLTESLGETKLDWLESRMSERASGAVCPAPKRSLFRNNKLAYYEYGVELLREALYTNAVTKDPLVVKEAAACLWRAFRERDGRKPSCGESLNGMWTTYYAPFLPAAVIESEFKRVR
jgi:hypothetical protein